jgi:negative regulator of genetic competence, sporulation and motility
MRIEKIRFNKIKVTFSTEDLIAHNLTPDAVRHNAPAAQEVFWRVLKQAEEETGFSAEDGRLMIEVHSFSDDSIVLYITKLDLDDSVPFSPSRKKVRMRVKTVEDEKSDELCLMFDSFEDSVSLANSSVSVLGGELYFYDGKYYIIASKESDAKCSEFGKVISSPLFTASLREKGIKICDDAAETLRANFRD